MFITHRKEPWQWLKKIEYNNRQSFASAKDDRRTLPWGAARVTSLPSSAFYIFWAWQVETMFPEGIYFLMGKVVL
jgi:hypothetical protein